MHPRVRPHAQRRSVLAAALLACFGVLLSSETRGQLAVDSPFSSRELALLQAGELVTREAEEERGSLRLLGGSSYQIINAAPSLVFQALLDTRQYARFMPAVTSSTLISQEADARVVRLEHKRGPLGLIYDVRANVYSDRQDIAIRLENAPSGAPRAAWGYFSVRPFGVKKTLLSWNVMADPGRGLVIRMLRGVVQEWMLRVPTQVKGYVEKRGQLIRK